MAGKNLPAVIPVEQYSIMQIEKTDLMEAIKVNLEGDKFTAMDLQRIKVPTGGGEFWSVPDLEEGNIATKEVTGILLMAKINRAYWDEAFGSGSGNKPPSCTSSDGNTGIGNPGGDCNTCPFAQYGSKIDDSGKAGPGQACKCVRVCALLMPEDVLPKILFVPPSSLKTIKQYMLALTGKGIPFYSALTTLSLSPAVSSGGIKYSEVTAKFAGKVSKEQAAVIKDIRHLLVDAMSNTNFAVDPVSDDEEEPIEGQMANAEDQGESEIE
jgi:hypothetical protein